MDTQETMYCRGLKHKADPDNTPETTFEKPWCSKKCEVDYLPKSKDKKLNNFQAFLERGERIKVKQQQELEAENAL